MKGFLLGLTNGGACLAVCLPAFAPYLLSEPRTVVQNLPVVGRFLLGRLASYLLWALLAWPAGKLAASHPSARPWGIGFIYIAGSLLLILYGFREQRPLCAAGSLPGLLSRGASRLPRLMPWLLGCLTGLSLCPPLLLAFGAAADTGSVAGSLWFFATFFLGTSIYFVPAPFLGPLARVHALRIIGRLAVGLMGVYYLYSGLTMLTKGAAQP
jgi:hypothetical protein